MSRRCERAGRWSATLLTAAVLGLASCVTGARVSEEEDRRAKAFSPPRGMANVYLVRRTSLVGGAVFAHVSMSRSPDSVEESELGNATYCLFTRPPGEYVVRVAWGDRRGSWRLDLRPDSCVFYEIGLGGVARLDLARVSQETGRTLVRECDGRTVSEESRVTPVR